MARSVGHLLQLLATTVPLAGQAVPSLPARQDFVVSPADADLTTIGMLQVSRRGAILVSQPKENLIRLFVPDGPTKAIGRRGEGPGEFRRLGAMGWLGDSLWTTDPALRRISIFSPDFSYVRSVAFPTAFSKGSSSDGPNFGELWTAPIALYPDGSLLMQVSFAGDSRMVGWAAGLDSSSTVLLRTSPQGQIRNTISVTPISPCSPVLPVGKSLFLFKVPFCTGPISTQGQGTPLVATVAAPSIDRAGGKLEYTATMRDAEGKVIYARKVPFTPRAIAKAELDSARQATLKAWARNPAARDVAAAQKYPRFHPPVLRAVIGRDATLWIEESVVGLEHHWRILGPDGAVIGTTKLPADVQLEVAERGTVWGIITDQDGLQGIVRYRLGR